MREGKSSSAIESEAMLPGLSYFNVLKPRVPDDYWLGDRSMDKRWAKRGRPDSALKRANADIGNRE